jgi:hypothetical protein
LVLPASIGTVFQPTTWCTHFRQPANTSNITRSSSPRPTRCWSRAAWMAHLEWRFCSEMRNRMRRGLHCRRSILRFSPQSQQGEPWSFRCHAVQRTAHICQGPRCADWRMTSNPNGRREGLGLRTIPMRRGCPNPRCIRNAILAGEHCKLTANSLKDRGPVAKLRLPE